MLSTTPEAADKTDHPAHEGPSDTAQPPRTHPPPKVAGLAGAWRRRQVITWSGAAARISGVRQVPNQGRRQASPCMRSVAAATCARRHTNLHTSVRTPGRRPAPDPSAAREQYVPLRRPSQPRPSRAGTVAHTQNDALLLLPQTPGLAAAEVGESVLGAVRPRDNGEVTHELRTALAQAANSGWATGSAKLDDLKREGRLHLSWTTRATRGHPEDADELRPVAQAQARLSSLSAVYGSGEQPLHTDGAHFRRPARWLLLASAETSSVPTLYWSYNSTEVDAQLGDALREGLFTVVSGPNSFLAPARSATMLRFDPGCMRPSDSRALVAADFLSTRKSAALEHAWGEPNKFLLLDNHRVLHARGGPTAEPSRLLHRIAFDLPAVAKR